MAAIRILSRRDVVDLLTLEQCIDAVEEAFRAHGEGRSIPPGVIGAHVEGGGFHIKAAGLLGERPYYAVKNNGNFHANPPRGLPRIQGLIVLSDAGNGTPVAVMDSTEITGLRTAAATAVAARHLAHPDADTITICGCGIQGEIQLAAVRCVRPIRKAWLVDRDAKAAESLAASIEDLAVEIRPPEELGAAVRASAITVTCTPSREPLIGAGDVAPGAFVAAVGADSEEKQEIDPALVASSKLVVDSVEQCATIGELHHALETGVMQREDVHAELAQVVAGRRPGRTTDGEVVIFDSTGVALQDVAAAILVYERACADDVGIAADLLG